MLAKHDSSAPYSKHTTTEYNRSKRVEQRLTGIYADVLCFHMTFAEYLDRKQAMLKSPDYQKLSSYYKGRIAGMSDLLFNSLYAYQHESKTPAPLMSVSYGPDGRMFPEGDDSWLQESSEYTSSLRCEHIWRRPWIERQEVRPWS